MVISFFKKKQGQHQREDKYCNKTAKGKRGSMGHQKHHKLPISIFIGNLNMQRLKCSRCSLSLKKEANSETRHAKFSTHLHQVGSACVLFDRSKRETFLQKCCDISLTQSWLQL